MAKRNKTQFIDVTKILPEKMPSEQKILWKNLEQDLLLIFTDKHGCKGGSRPKSIMIKRFISISGLLFEGLGLFVGDGLKLSQGQFKLFGFSNNEIELHRCFIKFSHQCLGLSPFLFRVRVSVPPKLQNDIQDIEKMFSRESEIPLENFNKPRIKKVNKPCFEVKFCSVLLGEIIQLLLKNLKPRLLSNKEFAASFLRGLIASEGNVSIFNDNNLRCIFIGAKEERRKKFIRKLLVLLGILPSKNSKESVVVSGRRNFKTMKKWNLCELHPDKNNCFNSDPFQEKEEHFMKGEARLIILNLLSKSDLKTKKELSKLLGMNVNVITNNLLVLKKKDLVKDVKVINKKKVWSITRDGLKLLNDDDIIAKLRNRN